MGGKRGFDSNWRHPPPKWKNKERKGKSKSIIQFIFGGLYKQEASRQWTANLIGQTNQKNIYQNRLFSKKGTAFLCSTCTKAAGTQRSFLCLKTVPSDRPTAMAYWASVSGRYWGFSRQGSTTIGS